jgi:hypothetical protein
MHQSDIITNKSNNMLDCECRSQGQFDDFKISVGGYDSIIDNDLFESFVIIISYIKRVTQNESL